MFHLHMNKVIQDLEFGMPSDVNTDDLLSLGHIKTYLGLHHISNDKDQIKRDGNYEYYNQFIQAVGSELLVEAFNNFLESKASEVEKSVEGARELILGGLKQMDIKYFYDPSNYEEQNVFDDCLTSCRDTAGRALISLCLDSVEHEGDGLGIRGLRTVMCLYFLNRKENHQDSQYAPRLLSNRVAFLAASKRTQHRIDQMACVNISGKPGGNVSRDEANEFEVRNAKTKLRGLHSQVTSLVVEKSIVGSNIMGQIESHDRQAMLLSNRGGGTSYRHLSEAQVELIRKEIQNIHPFSLQREKISYYDKPRGMFSGLKMDQIERFISRNKKKYGSTKY